MTREEAIWYLQPIADSASLERYKEALGMAIAALREQPQWISVVERLPEMKADVLMYFKGDKNMAVGFMCDIDEDKTMWCAYTDSGFYTDCDFEPTYWTPLPEAPEEEV